MELAGSASWDSGDQSDQPLHNDSKHWDYCWVHHSSPEHCCALPGVVPDCQIAVEDAAGSDYHIVAGIGDATSSDYAGGTDHGSMDWVAPDFSVENPAKWVLLLEACPWSFLFLASISLRLLSITTARFTSS
jgi:hypothetical protein